MFILPLNVNISMSIFLFTGEGDCQTAGVQTGPGHRRDYRRWSVGWWPEVPRPKVIKREALRQSTQSWLQTDRAIKSGFWGKLVNTVLLFYPLHEYARVFIILISLFYSVDWHGFLGLSWLLVSWHQSWWCQASCLRHGSPAWVTWKRQEMVHWWHIQGKQNVNSVLF